MASTLRSHLGSGSAGGGWSVAGTPAPGSSHHHGILHNLLEDAINTAKGIPFGMEQLATHPVRSVKLMGKSYADTYGHGFHHFWKTFEAHPLQPLLDAISIPLLFAGGAGAALKGATAFADVGRSAEIAGALKEASVLRTAGDYAAADAKMAEASRFPGLTKLAQHSQPGTQHTIKLYDTGQGFSLPKAYSNNMFRRFMMQKPFDAVMEGMIGKKVGFFSTAGKGRRLAQAEISRRGAAAASRAFGQAQAITAAKKAGIPPAVIGHMIEQNFEHVAMSTGIKVPVAQAQHMKGKEFTGVGAETTFTEPYIDKVDSIMVNGEKRVALRDAQTGDSLGHVPEWVADEVSKTAKFEPDWNHHMMLHMQAQFGLPLTGYLSPGRPAWTVPTDETVLASKSKDIKIMVAHPSREVPTGEPLRRTGHALQSYEDEHVKNFIHTLGGRFKFTDDPAKMHVDRDGMVTLMRREQIDMMRKEVDGAAELARKVYFAPLTVWKAMILAQSPRYFVNNVIGNAGMYAAATSPVEFTRGFVAAVKSVKGIRAAKRVEVQAGNHIDGIMAKFLPNEFVHEEFGFLQHGALSLGRTIEKGRTPFGRRHALTPFYGITEKVAYRGPQRSSIMGAMTSMPGFRAAMRVYKSKGLGDYEAFQAASKDVLKSPGARAAVEKRVTDWAGQYYHLNSLERNLTAVVPFYNWTRHALRFGKEQVLARPAQSAVLSQIGALGDKEAKKELGNLPDFLKGAVPVGGHASGVLGFLLGQNMVGRKKIVLTSGYNPLAAAAEDAHAIAALVGARSPREALSSQINPIISGFLSGMTGQRLFSGAQTGNTTGGPVGEALKETFAELPLPKAIRAAIKEPSTKTKKGDSTLYAKNVRQDISSLLGLNERDFSPAAAEKLYREEHHIKKGRRHARKAAQGLLKSTV